MSADDPCATKLHQRIGAISNTHAGRDFETAVQRHFAEQSLLLEQNFAVEIGHERKKPHRFDLGSADPAVLVECKSYAWTVTGNSPSAKIRSLNEAMLHFMLAPAGFRKLLVMQWAERLPRGESLASYYVRTQGHLIPSDVEIWQFDPAQDVGQRIAVGVDSQPIPPMNAPADRLGVNWRMPKTADFAEAIQARLREAGRRGAKHIDINAGDLHRELGGYPGPRASMPSCCNAMYAAQKSTDEILAQPPKRKGASLTIRYRLPR